MLVIYVSPVLERRDRASGLARRIYSTRDTKSPTLFSCHENNNENKHKNNNDKITRILKKIKNTKKIYLE